MKRLIATLSALFLLLGCFSACEFKTTGTIICDNQQDCPKDGYSCKEGFCVKTAEINPEVGGDKIQTEVSEPIAEQLAEPTEEPVEPKDSGELIPEKEVEVAVEQQPEQQQEVEAEKIAEVEIEIDPCEKYKDQVDKECVTGEKGVCGAGTYSCSSGKLNCDRKMQPSTETCDGLDNNCDGQVDENVQNCCAPGQTRDCGNVPEKGLCKKGKQTCKQDRIWDSCLGLVEPKPEICDGQDNNCDGLVDEGLGDTTCGIGECKVTVQNCQGGKIVTCAPKTPGVEICNGKDDNCDGQVDEGLGTITCGKGECLVTVNACVGGKTQSCTPKQPQAETCNNKDDDCDGLVDNVDVKVVEADVNNCGKCGNVCQFGPKSNAVCSGGKCGLECTTGFTNPEAEIPNKTPDFKKGCYCQKGYGIEIPGNGIDDDCDGTIDNIDPSLVTVLDFSKASGTIIPNLVDSSSNGTITTTTSGTPAIINDTTYGKVLDFTKGGRVEVPYVNAPDLTICTKSLVSVAPVQNELRYIWWDSDEQPSQGTKLLNGVPHLFSTLFQSHNPIVATNINLDITGLIGKWILLCTIHDNTNHKFTLCRDFSCQTVISNGYRVGKYTYIGSDDHDDRHFQGKMVFAFKAKTAWSVDKVMRYVALTK